MAFVHPAETFAKKHRPANARQILHHEQTGERIEVWKNWWSDELPTLLDHMTLECLVPNVEPILLTPAMIQAQFLEELKEKLENWAVIMLFDKDDVVHGVAIVLADTDEDGVVNSRLRFLLENTLSYQPYEWTLNNIDHATPQGPLRILQRMDMIRTCVKRHDVVAEVGSYSQGYFHEWVKTQTRNINQAYKQMFKPENNLRFKVTHNGESRDSLDELMLSYSWLSYTQSTLDKRIDYAGDKCKWDMSGYFGEVLHQLRLTRQLLTVRAYQGDALYPIAIGYYLVRRRTDGTRSLYWICSRRRCDVGKLQLGHMLHLEALNASKPSVFNLGLDAPGSLANKVDNWRGVADHKIFTIQQRDNHLL